MMHCQSPFDDDQDRRDERFEPNAWNDIDDDDFDPEPVADDVRDDFGLDEDDDVDGLDEQFWDEADER
jgi:hypothetical protein